DPPLVLWSLQSNSDVFAVYSGAKNFAINVLAGNQQELSSRYARKGDHLLDPEHFTPGEHGGAPIINDALVSFECSLDTVHPGGDHVIIVARVDAMHVRPEGEPLLFYSGAYRALA
ncbi:MAG: flavin reductase family protein, partial [Haliea sp.]